jgi:3-phenylpropionate/trans-cinnamate dioxygenase ferredoxin subunit
MVDWVDVDAVATFGLGERRVVDVDGVAVLVVNVNGEYLAVEDLCSHQEFPLSDGELRQDRIVCSRHGAEFCLRTGAALTAPAYEGIATLPVRIEGDRVQVCDDRWG